MAEIIFNGVLILMAIMLSFMLVIIILTLAYVTFVTLPVELFTFIKDSRKK